MNENYTCWHCKYYARIKLGEDDSSDSYFADCTNEQSETFNKLKFVDNENILLRRSIIWSHKSANNCLNFKIR
jgi:hypothetical protein